MTSTTVFAGAGLIPTFRRVLGDAGQRRFVLVDGSTLSVSRAVDRYFSVAMRGAAGIHIIEGPVHPSVALLREIADELVRTGADHVVAIGGGATLDMAKAVVASQVEPELFAPHQWTTQSGLTASARHLSAAGVAVVAVPTTFWTSSEVSPIAILKRSPVAAKRLFASAALAPSAAVLDEDMFETIPAHLIRLGAFELFTRLFVPACVAPGRAIDLAARCVDVSSTAVRLRHLDAAACLDLAVVGANDRMRIPSERPDPFANTLWYLAAAVEDFSGCTKQQALCSLARSYAKHLEDRIIGDRRAVDAVCSAAIDAAAWTATHPSPVGVLDAALGELRLEVALADLGVRTDDVELLTRRVRQRWGFALGEMQDADVDAIYVHALARSPRSSIPPLNPSASASSENRS